MEDDSTVTIAVGRVQRLINALSLLSLDLHDSAQALIDVDDSDDRMSFLEHGLSIFIDELATAKKENEAYIAELELSRRELEAKLETIELQRDAIRQLSTPVIELWDEIVILPVVGLVDTQRSIEMTEALLERIHEARCRWVIIDVTGVDMIDSMTANHFLTMIRAAQLLGARCVVTGMSPSIAQTIISLGVDMGELSTLRSLKDGLLYCLRQLRTSKTKGRD